MGDMEMILQMYFYTHLRNSYHEYFCVTGLKWVPQWLIGNQSTLFQFAAVSQQAIAWNNVDTDLKSYCVTMSWNTFNIHQACKDQVWCDLIQSSSYILPWQRPRWMQYCVIIDCAMMTPDCITLIYSSDENISPWQLILIYSDTL